MKILLLSADEENAFLLRRLQDEGNEVKLLTKTSIGVWKGVIELAESPAAAVEWGPDLVLVDSPGFGEFVQRFRELGIAVVGGGTFADKISQEYLTSMLFLEASQCRTCDYYDVETAEGIYDYVSATDRPWRVIGGDRHFKAFDDNARLEAWFESNPEYKGFVLVPDIQVPKQNRFKVAGFVNSRGSMNPAFVYNCCYGMGIFTTEGVTLKRIANDHPIVQVSIGKVAEKLYGMGYQGPVFLDCVVDPTEEDNEDEYTTGSAIRIEDFTLTPPDGFWAAFARGLDMPLHYFLDRLANPRRPNTPFDFSKGYVSSRKVSVPPYPMTEAPWIDEEKREALKAMMPREKVYADPHIYWSGVSRQDDGMYDIVNPVVGYLTGKGPDQAASRTEITNAWSDLKIPYSNVAIHSCASLEIVDLPTWTARRQLEEELLVINGR